MKLEVSYLGHTTGCVLDVGARESRATPIYEGKMLRHHIKTNKLGGKHLDELLNRFTDDKGWHFYNQFGADAKESHGYVCLDPEAEMKVYQSTREMDRRVKVGDQVQTISTERWRCPEALFRPTSINECPDIKKEKPVQELVAEAIMKSPVSMKSKICQNIVLTGGGTMFPGFNKRLELELSKSSLLSLDGAKDFESMVSVASDQNTSLSKIPVDLQTLTKGYLSHRIEPSKYGNLSTWKGGSVLAQIDGFEKFCVAKGSYDEFGALVPGPSWSI